MFFRFDLTFAGVTTVLATEEQPEGIDSLESELKRDFDASGVFFKLTGEDLKLRFPGTGRQIFKTARDTDGVDADVLFEMFKRSDEFQDWTLIFSGNAVMEDVTFDIDYASVDFAEINLLNTITNRQEIPAPLDSTEDMDGNAISAAVETAVAVQGRPILQESTGIIRISSAPNLTDGLITIDSVAGEFSANTSIFLEKTNEIDWSTFKGFEGSDPSLAASRVLIGGELRAQFEFETYVVTIRVSGKISFKNDGATVTGSVALILEQDEALAGITTHIIDTYTLTDYDTGPVGDPIKDFAERETIDFSIALEVVSGEDTTFKLGFAEQVGIAGSGTAFIFTDGVFTNAEGVFTQGLADLEFTIEINRVAPETTVSSYFMHEALRHNIEQMTGLSNALDAPFFGRTEDGYPEDGAAAHFVQFNGYRARGFSSRSVVNIFKESLESLISIFNVGFGIEEDYNGDFTLKIAPREHFYADVELVAFTDVVDYEEEFFDWFMVNKLEIGYEKFSGDDEFPGTLNDFNTLATYLTPFVSVEGSRIFKSKFIGSDILLEVTRRKQFDVTPTESWKYDDDLFIMDVQDVYDTGTFEQGSIYQVDNIGINYEGLSPINLTINPRFNAYNFFALFNTFLFKKPLTSPFRNKEYKVNGEEKIFYTGGSPELGDTEIRPDGSGAPRVDANLVALESGNRLFDPIQISFKVAMSSAQVDSIVAAHRNAAPTANYGYITVTNNEGETKKGWLLDLKYNIIDEIGTFELITRSENYQI